MRSHRPAVRVQAAPPPSRPILPRTADFASVSGGSHPSSGAAYILILTVSGMPGKAGARTWVGGPGRCGIPSTSTRAITPRPEGKLRIVAGGRAGYAGHLNVVDLRGMLPSVRGVIGLRQVDGMPHQCPLVSDEAERGRAAPGRRGLSVGRRVSA